MNTIEKMAMAARAAISCQIAHSAERALKALGLPLHGSIYQQAYDAARLVSPLYVFEICINGQVARDMYDEHPGYAFYYSDSSECLEDVPAYCSISRAKEIAIREFTKLALMSSERESTYDGDFTPYSIVLSDQFGGPLMEYANGKWLDDLPSEAEWPALLEQATHLADEASEEARWDNFETSKALSHRAEAIRRRIKCAQAIARAIH